MNKKSLLEKKKEIKNSLIKYGISEIDSETIADCLYISDLYGVYSHGTKTINDHFKRIENHLYNLNPVFQIIKSTPSFAIIDGDNSIGIVSAKFSLDYAIRKAEKNGIYSVFSKNNNTFGPAFYYSYLAAKKGYMALVCSNAPAQMALTNGTEKMIGTNPFSFVIPVPGDEPIIIDMASSIVAKSKFKLYQETNQLLPEGWALDKNGKPTTNPEDAIDGFVQPMAGIKGISIAIIVDVLSGLLSGSSYLNDVGRFYCDNGCMDVGFFITVFNPDLITNGMYECIIKDYVHKLRNSKHLKGTKIIVPGDDRINHMKNIENKSRGN